MWARILSKHLGNASQVWVVARKRGPGGVRAVGVVRARGGVGTHWQPLNTLETLRGAGGCGHALAAFKYSLNT